MADEVEVLGTCDDWGGPHPKCSMCYNWHPFKPAAAAAEIVKQKADEFGVWHNGTFIRVDLGALGTLISLKDVQIEELRTTVKAENERLTAENQTLRFQIDNEKEFTKMSNRCLLDANEKVAELTEKVASAASAQMFGEHCVCKWQGGKVISLCGAHHALVHDGIKYEKDKLADKFRKLTEAL